MPFILEKLSKKELYTYINYNTVRAVNIRDEIAQNMSFSVETINT
ncbi:MAG: hypothetical protein RR623_05455 [Bacilli bacterium]